MPPTFKDSLDKTKLLLLNEAKKNPESPICKLTSNHDIFKHIFDGITQEHKDKAKHIIADQNSYCICSKMFPHIRLPQPMFPSGTDININMMPIQLTDFDQWNHPLLDYLNGYKHLIAYCIHLQKGGWYYDSYNNKKPKIGYLTIHESWVQPAQTQRRPGVHIESPKGHGTIIHQPDCKTIDGLEAYYNSKWRSISWGNGTYSGDQIQDGIYIASNVDDMAKFFPFRVENSEEFTDRHGGIEDFREYLGDGELMKKDTVYWITDKTPHESLPNPTDKPIYRQFFRLVVGPVDVWYSQHNTPNPLGIQPDAQIVHYNKF
jgi:hypothetical protein